MFFKFRNFFILFIIPIVTISAQLIPYGTQQIYDFTNDVRLTDLKQTPYSSGYRIKSSLAVTSLFTAEDLEVLQFELDSPKIHIKSGDSRKLENYKEKSSNLNDLSKQEIYLLLENGRISKIYTINDKNPSLLNLKRAIVSLFQFQLKDGVLSENDISGKCNVIYHTKSSTKYKKLKTDCSNWILKVHHRMERPLDVSRKSYNEISYDLSQDGILQKLKSLETHRINVEANSNVGNLITSKINLNHIRASEIDPPENLQKILDILEKFEEIEIHGDIDGGVNEKQDSIKKFLKEYKSDLENDKIGTKTAALILGKLIPIVRNSNVEELIQILKSRTFSNVHGQLLDLFGAAQTTETYKAVNNVFNFDNDENFEQIERYLQALSVGTRPNDNIILDLLMKLTKSTIENSKLLDTIVQTIASMSYRSSQISPKGFANPVVHKIHEYLITELRKCETTECKEIYIRSLENFKDPNTILILMEIALEGDRICSVAAMNALRAFPIKYFNSENQKAFSKIFYQTTKKFDSSARTLALDIIFDLKPNRDQIEELLKYLKSNDKSFEAKTYLLQKIKMIMDKCPRFSALIKGILKENPDLNNYHVISQKGLTTALQRTLSKSPSSNETLVSVQEVFNGVLKRGVVDMILEANQEQTKIFSLGLYTNGLTSFIGGGGSDDEESEETPEDDDIPTAGMKITVQGVNLRPLEFFKGQSQLMGHVWSGTASEPTPAYQATTMLQDHEEYILLQNGATIYLQVFGTKSIDLNGQIQISIWNRNAHTEINKNSGVAVIGTVDVFNSFIRLKNSFTITEEPKISLVADIDFYSGVKLCIRLDRAESSLLHNITKIETIMDTKYLSRNSLKLNYKIPGYTMALNQKNNEMCNIIFNQV